MLSKLREILLTQYIGSILVALLAWQAVVEIIIMAARARSWFFNAGRSQSVLEGSSSSLFPWDTVIFSGVTVVLYLLTAYGLARWLYPEAAHPIVNGSQESPDEHAQL
jgi:hypothetical protein